MKTIGSILGVLLLLSAGSISAAPQPMDALKPPIENGLALLQDPQYKDPSKKELQRQKIWEIVQQAFDFVEVSARAVAADWRNFTPQERKEFTEVFTELLKNTYLDKVQGAYHNEKVVFLNQDMISEDKAVVKTKVLRENLEIPIDYSMRFRDGSWKVYDVHVEGISLIKNYRTQFRDILSRDKPAVLIQQLKEKNQKQKDERTK